MDANVLLRPNQILPDDQAQPGGWDIGPNRFPFSAQNRYFNLTKEAQFADPNAQFNLTNRASFGTFNGTRGSFSDIGTGRMHHLLVGRFVF